MKFSYLVSKLNCYLRIGSKNLDALPLLIWFVTVPPVSAVIAWRIGIPLRIAFLLFVVLTLGVNLLIIAIDYFIIAHYEIKEEDYLDLYLKLKKIEKLPQHKHKLREVKKFIRDCLKQKGYLSREDCCIVENAINIISLKQKSADRRQNQNWKEKLSEMVNLA